MAQPLTEEEEEERKSEVAKVSERMHHPYTAAVEMVKTDLLFPFSRLIGTWEGHHTPPGWSLG